MVVRVALQLVASPQSGWDHLRDALEARPSSACPDARVDRLPGGPHAVLAGAGLASLAATAFGWALRPGSTTAGAVLHVLAGSLAYVAGPLIALSVGSSTAGSVSAETDPAHTARYPWFVVAATLPVSLSGVGNVVPFLSISFALALAGAALSARSGWVGASAMLALSGQARIRAAAAPAGLAAGVALLATSIRMVLPS